MKPRVRYLQRRLIDKGCDFCRPLFAYTVTLEDGTLLGEVRGLYIIERHPREWHYGRDWEAVLPDGTRARGRYAFNNWGDVGERFINRELAGDALLTHYLKGKEEADA